MKFKRNQTGDQDLHKDRLRNELIRHFRMRLGLLLPHEAKILADYFGIDRDRSCTFEEIGERFGLTREQVEKIVNRAIARLRDTSAESGLGHQRRPKGHFNEKLNNELKAQTSSPWKAQPASNQILLAEEKEILRLYFGIAREMVNSIEGLAMRLKLSSAQARRMRKQAILKLRMRWGDWIEGRQQGFAGPSPDHRPAPRIFI